MSNSQFNDILKAVSRSFYLSIRVLPKPMRAPISVAYLLARAADAIVDSASISTENRLEFLFLFRQTLSSANEQTFQFLAPLIANVDHDGEQELLLKLPAIVQVYQQLNKHDKSAVNKVVNTLTIGMENDLTFFSDKLEVKALADDEALNKYSYYVAGCVGEFWTTLSLQYTPSLSHWQSEKMMNLGIDFGKALQLTNIMRDIAKDLKLGRCYLPASDLESYQLDTQMMADKENNLKFKPVLLKWIDQADTYFTSAECYLLSIPRHCFRLRLASLWPILIGLATLKLIKRKENFLDANINVKIKRNWVYKMLILSLFAVFSNSLLRYWIKTLRTNSIA